MSFRFWRRSKVASGVTLNLRNSRDSLLFGLSGAKFTVGSLGKRALVDGCRELVLGNEDTALRHLEQAAHLAEGACFAGFLALKNGLVEEAAGHLTRAADKHNRLGRYLSKNDISVIISLPITDEISGHVGPVPRGVLLGLVEAYQRLERWRDAGICLR